MDSPADLQEQSTDLSDEIDAALDQDERKIGEFWRAQKQTGDVNEIAAEMGWETPSAVYSYRTYINVLRGTASPTVSMALQCRRQIGSFIRRHNELSAQAKDILSSRQASCDSIAESYDEPDSSVGEEADIELGAGVYVYTLPHYIRHPVVDKPDASSTPRTFLKVGKSDTNVDERIRQQATTALPEPPVTLRVYQGADYPGKVEKRLHEALDAADHNPNRAKGAGKEWFLTNLKFLDAVAAMLDLKIHRLHEDMTTELET